MPVMLLNVSILLFVVGVLILVWEQATRDLALNHDLKVDRNKIQSLMFGLTCVQSRLQLLRVLGASLHCSITFWVQYIFTDHKQH